MNEHSRLPRRGPGGAPHLLQAIEYARILRAIGDLAGAAHVLDMAFEAESRQSRPASDSLRHRALIERADLALRLEAGIAVLHPSKTTGGTERSRQEATATGEKTTAAGETTANGRVTGTGGVSPAGETTAAGEVNLAGECGSLAAVMDVLPGVAQAIAQLDDTASQSHISPQSPPSSVPDGEARFVPDGEARFVPDGEARLRGTSPKRTRTQKRAITW